MACSRLTDFFCYIMHQRNDVIYSYLGLIGVLCRIHEAFDYLLDLLHRLGFPISKSKLVPPTKVCNCLGVMVDTTNKTVSVTQEKLEEMLKKCKKVNNSTQVTLKELQSLIGFLMFLHKCVRPTRIFINRLSDSLRGVEN